MTIDEAIKRLIPFAEGEKTDPDLEDLDAFQIGIEGLKKLKRLRNTYPADTFQLLPGETEE